MSFELQEKMTVLTQFGFATLINLPDGQPPEPLEEEIPPPTQQLDRIASCPSSPQPPKEEYSNQKQSDKKSEENEAKKISKLKSDHNKPDEPIQDEPKQPFSPPPPPPPPLPIQPKASPPIPASSLPPLGKPSKQISSNSMPDDPLPFSNSFSQPSTHTEQQTKKPPILKRLTNDLKESLVLAKKLEIKYKFPYSNDERIVGLDFGLGKLYTMVKNISNVIFLLVKTFFGQRHYYLAIIPITFNVDQLKQLIIDGIGQNQRMFHNIKLIHPMLSLKEISNQKIIDTKLKDFSQLMFLAEMTFTWDPIKKGKSIVLSSNNLMVTKKGQTDYQTVLGTLAMNSGRHYWEIKIEKFVDEEDIFIGIARKEIDLYTQPTSTGHFYGYICLCAKKFGTDGQIIDYGYNAVQNDVIGVKLEFWSGIGTLTFYRNGINCGEAFNNLTGTFYPALSMFYGEVRIVDPRNSTSSEKEW